MGGIRGGSYIAIGQSAKMAIQLVGIAVLSRLVEPAAFGAMALALVAVNFGEMLRDLGLVPSMLRSSKLTDREYVGFFWLAVAIGSGLAITVALIGLVMQFLGAPTGLIMASLSWILVVNAAQSVLLVRLSRDGRYLAVAVTDVAGQGVALLSAVLVARQIDGLTALIVQFVTAPVITLGLRFWCARWRPESPRHGASMREHLAFGIRTAGIQLGAFVANNAPIVTIAAVSGSSTTGQFNRATQLIQGPAVQLAAPLTQVALPLMARTRDDPRGIERIRRLTHSAMVLFALPTMLIVFGGTSWLIPIALGDGWEQAEVFAAPIAIVVFLQVVGNAHYWIALDSGKPGSFLKLSLWLRGMTVAATVVAGFAFGADAAAWAFALSTLAAWPATLRWLIRSCDVSRRYICDSVLAVGLFFSGAIAVRLTDATVMPTPLTLAITTATIATIASLAFLALVEPARSTMLQILVRSKNRE